MSLRADLYAYLAAQSAVTDLVGTRIYPEWNASGNETLPYVVYTLISESRDPHLGSASGLVRSTVQIDVYAATTRSMDAVADAIRGELDGFRGTWNESTVVRECHLESRRNGHETDGQAGNVGVFRASLDYRIWHVETVPTFT
jgi:hypothetical protein